MPKGFSWPGNSHHNRGLRNTDKSNLHELFPLPSKSIETRGTNMGVILRFQTFYLKIYDDVGIDGYRIKGYRYHEQHPVFDVVVPAFQLREFGMQFDREDHLVRFMEPCDDPNCVILQEQMVMRYQ